MNWLSGVDLGVFNTSLPTMAMVAWLAWHLNGKFHKIEKDLNNLVDHHELKDQTRHLENLERFTKLEVGQARMEHNGHYTHHDKKETS